MIDVVGCVEYGHGGDHCKKIHLYVIEKFLPQYGPYQSDTIH
jgi:hypothetical protein